ncbi:Proteasome subunit alpha type-6 [Gurleya vavrai]
MSDRHKYYNVFSPTGKLVQVENALQCIDSSSPIVVVKDSDVIYAISRKTLTKLEYYEPSTFQISENVYGTSTGYPGDVYMVKNHIQRLSTNKEYNLGFEPTPDIISRLYADKVQKSIQSTGTRSFAFSMAIFGFDELSSIWYTDVSGVCYPYKGIASGLHRVKMNHFLEKHWDEEKILEVGLECIGLSIGNGYGPGDVEVAVLKKDSPMVFLEHEQIDDVLTRIHEKE